MPVDFLSDKQVARYGRFADAPSRAQLERGFFLDDVDRALADQRRGDHNRLGFGVQLGTLRSLGTFLADPMDVPAEAVAYVGEQLGIADVACFGRYAERLPTQHEHAREICRTYGYPEYGQAAPELRAFLAAGAWASSDGPMALFNQATAWMLEQKIILPGATVLARQVSEVRAEVSERMWRTVAQAVSPELERRLLAVLNIEEGSRVSTLERLRTAPSRTSGPEMVRALERVAEVRHLGAAAVDTSVVPKNLLAVLARFGMTAKAPQLRQLTEPRRTATLVATLSGWNGWSSTTHSISSIF